MKRNLQNYYNSTKIAGAVKKAKAVSADFH